MSSPENRIIRWPDVKEKTGLCRSYIHLLISEGSFPAQIKLGKRASGWIESEIDQWIDDRISESRNNDTAA